MLDQTSTPQARPAETPWDDRIDALAHVGVVLGLNLQPGQELIVTAPAEALPLVRAVARHAYAAGARQVTPILRDDAVTRARFLNGTQAALDGAPVWLYDGMAGAFAGKAARLAILGDDPALLADLPAADCTRAARANAVAYRPVTRPIASFATNWTILAYPCAAWAMRVFPDLDRDQAIDRLAEQIFGASRLLAPDPIADWRRHTADLAARVDYLNQRAFSALRFVGEGTDLTVGLAHGHRWQGGVTTTTDGLATICNIPTEEVFTVPHRDRVEGWVRASKLFFVDGSPVHGLRLRFAGGKAVEVRAEQGQDRIEALLATDDGASRLGEVALVPHNSPIAQSGLVFQNILFDENAASHLAFGQCYAKCFHEPSNGECDLAQRGGNTSAIHQDWMIGSETMDVFAITAEGGSERLMQKGEWV